MKKGEIRTYKPKQSNVIKLETYLKKIEQKDGKQHKLGRNILQ
jgi:hypothetical protein